MTKDEKARLVFIRKNFKKVDEKLLDLFEKREILIIEDGTDLKGFKR
jgi:hypothetical protein